MPLNSSQISVILFLLVTTSIGCSSACPSGCICRGRPEQRDTAVCYKPWPHRKKAVEFDEPITSVEFRQLLYQDILPYLSAARRVSNVVIYPSMKKSSDNPLPTKLFNGMEKLETLTIHRTTDGLAPAGLGKAIKPLTTLKTLDLVGNTLQCDCSLPDAIASQKVVLLSQSMPVIKGCKRHGFPSDLYKVYDFLEKCAERGGYKLPEPSAAEVLPRAHKGLLHRKFGNIRDKKLFKSGIKYTRINKNRKKPSVAKAAPRAFSGALGKPPSGDRGRRPPGVKRVLLPGAISGRARLPPAISASDFGKRYGKAKHRYRKWGRRKLLSFDEEEDGEPKHSEVITSIPGEETRWRRQAGNKAVPRASRKRVRKRKKRRRKPIKMLPGMTMEEFINLHKKRRRGRRRKMKKDKNGWIRLSDGWRYREIRSVEAENISDTDLSAASYTSTNEEMQQSIETSNQEVPPRSKRAADKQGSNLGDDVNRTNRPERPLSGKETHRRRKAGKKAVPRASRKRVRKRKKRRRKPIKMLPGMTMEEFINLHKKRRRGRRRKMKKDKNGWIRLSDGWRYREIRSVEAENISDTDLSAASFTPTNEEMQQSIETSYQEVPPRSKRATDKQGSNLGDDVNRTNRTEHLLPDDTPNQSLNENSDQQTLRENLEGSLGVPPEAVQSNPPGNVNSRRRPAGRKRNHDHDHDHPHRHIPAERAHQLAVYQLPLNDLTLKLNPFDPFEVDLFFQYILHNEHLREHQVSSHPHS